MDRRQAIGMAAGVVWALALLVGAAIFVRLPVFAVLPTIMVAYLAPGLVMLAMAAWRFRGEVMGEGEAAETDERVLADTTVQMVLALAVWPAAAVLLGAEGPGVIMVLGFGLAAARLAFWIGCRRAPGLRAFGAVASLLPTVLVALWALWRAAT